jgi:hypothetical protein
MLQIVIVSQTSSKTDNCSVRDVSFTRFNRKRAREVRSRKLVLMDDRTAGAYDPAVTRTNTKHRPEVVGGRACHHSPGRPIPLNNRTESGHLVTYRTSIRGSLRARGSRRILSNNARILQRLFEG